MADINDDNPESDGCELDFTEEEDDEETAALRPLFPDGDASKEAEWNELFPTSSEDATSEGA